MADAAGPVLSAPGLQHHSRSMLVWPRELDASASALLSELIVTGARVLSLGEPLPPGLGQLAPRPVPLSVWHGKQSALAAQPHTRVPQPPEWQALVRLWLDSGITPLSGHTARDSPAWRHAWHGTPPAASASAQRLTTAFPGTSAGWLVCCVATRQEFRGKQLAASCIASVIPEGQSAVAFVEPSADSGGFFRRIGWSESGQAFLYHYYHDS